MKKRINILVLSLIAFSVLIAVIVAAFVFPQNRYDYHELVEFRINISGTITSYEIEYSLTCKEGVWVASRTEREFDERNTREVVVDDEFANHIGEILKKNKVHKWNNIDIGYEIKERLQLNSISTDGEYYSFYLQLSDGQIMQNKEYNRYPKTFFKVFYAFKEEFEVLLGD